MIRVGIHHYIQPLIPFQLASDGTHWGPCAQVEGRPHTGNYGMPVFAYKHQGQWRTACLVDDYEKYLSEQFERKASDGCNKMDDARIFVSRVARVVP